MYQAEIFKFVDLENSRNEHISISGGKATHSTIHVDMLSDSDLSELINLVKKLYGNNEFDRHENILYLSIPEKEWEEKECPEHYQVFFNKLEMQELNLENI